MILKIVMGALMAWGMAAGVSLAGEWEIQSMGSDRAVTISQKGERVTAYRVMWPEFEGEKYKLEHMYKGRISGKTIEGDLLVREGADADESFINLLPQGSPVTEESVAKPQSGDGGIVQQVSGGSKVGEMSIMTGDHVHKTTKVSFG